jgi:hypothetical protein
MSPVTNPAVVCSSVTKLALLLLGLVTVRVVGLLSAGSAGTVIYLGLMIELIGAALALWALARISIYGEPESGRR